MIGPLTSKRTNIRRSPLGGMLGGSGFLRVSSFVTPCLQEGAFGLVSVI